MRRQKIELQFKNVRIYSNCPDGNGTTQRNRTIHLIWSEYGSLILLRWKYWCTLYL